MVRRSITARPTAIASLCSLVALALAGCGVQSPTASTSTATSPSATAGTSTSESASSTSPATKATTATPQSKRNEAPITGSNPITISFIGDVHFERESLSAIARDPQGMAPLKKLLSAADITVANLETAITEGGSPQPDKQFTFRAPASALTTMANAGIDIAGMANNHAADFNTAGLKDTLAAKVDAPLKVMGVGHNVDEATAPVVYTIDGVTIAFLNASQLWEKTTEMHSATDTSPGIAQIVRNDTAAAAGINPDRFVAAVKDAAARYDVVITFLHYGTELEKCPTANQFAAVKLLSAAGADMVIGGHSHRVQAGGWTGNTYVDYGLGSFTWWMRGSDPSTGMLTISVDKAKVAAKRALAEDQKSEAASVVTKQSWTAMEIGTSGLPFVPDAAAVDRMVADRDSLLTCSKLRATP